MPISLFTRCLYDNKKGFFEQLGGSIPRSGPALQGTFLSVEFDTGNKSKVAVQHEEKRYMIEVSPTRDPAEYGKVEVIDERQAVLFFNPEVSSMNALAARLRILANGAVESTIIFNDSPPIGQDLGFLAFNQARNVEIRKQLDAIALSYVIRNFNSVQNIKVMVPLGVEATSWVMRKKHVFIDGTINVHLEDIMSLVCERITIEDSTLTPTDINTFIKSWINGHHSSLKYFKIGEIGSIENARELHDGIKIFENEETAKYSLQQAQKDSDCNGNTVGVRNKKGALATITCADNGAFYFIVWD